MRTEFAAVAALASMLFASATHAATVAGEVTFVNGGGGEFILLDGSSSFEVGVNHFDTVHMYAFDEQQNVSLKEDLVLADDVTISAGTDVSSHYVFFDALTPMHQKGWVSFDSEILGFATTPYLLRESDHLASASVTYVGDRLRGLEANDYVMIDENDPTRLFVSWHAAHPGDYMRVITAGGALTTSITLVETPLPAPALMLLGGLAGLAALRRRR